MKKSCRKSVSEERQTESRVIRSFDVDTMAVPQENSGKHVALHRRAYNVDVDIYNSILHI